MQEPDKPTERLERLIDLGEKIIAELKALTMWTPTLEEHPRQADLVHRIEIEPNDGIHRSNRGAELE